MLYATIFVYLSIAADLIGDSPLFRFYRRAFCVYVC